jgi:hypothetical protein
VSFLVVAPEWVESATADLANIRSALDTAHLAAAAPTTGIAAAGADEVSAAVASLFGGFGEEFQALSAQASKFHAQFVQALSTAGGSYLAAEAANASPLQTIEQSLLGAISTPAAAASSPLQSIEQFVIGVINTPTEILFGRQLISTGTVPLAGTITGGKATTPISMYAGTEARVNAAVGAGAPVRLLVDSGSTGLVIPYQNVGGLFGVLQLGLPSNIGLGGYSGGIDYFYATYNAQVNFGGGLVTHSTPVNVEFFAFPTTIQSAINNGFTFQSYFASDGVQGVLGVGPNAGGPGTSIPTQALASPYNGGLLIAEKPTTGSPYVQFTNTNPGTAIAALPGSPITNVDVTVTQGATTNTYNGVQAMFDSGGVDGTIPFNAPTGSVVTVYEPGTHVELYTYIMNGNYSPIAATGLMNTGAAPFQQNPIYISYAGNGTTYIDKPL